MTPDYRKHNTFHSSSSGRFLPATSHMLLVKLSRNTATCVCDTLGQSVGVKTGAAAYQLHGMWGSALIKNLSCDPSTTLQSGAEWRSVSVDACADGPWGQIWIGPGG